MTTGAVCGTWPHRLRALQRELGGSFTKRDLMRAHPMPVRNAQGLLGELRRRGEIACIALEDTPRGATPTKRYVVVLGERDLHPPASTSMLRS